MNFTQLMCGVYVICVAVTRDLIPIDIIISDGSIN